MNSRPATAMHCVGNSGSAGRGWPQTGARSGAEASPVTDALRRAPEWAVRGQDPPGRFRRQLVLVLLTTLIGGAALSSAEEFRLGIGPAVAGATKGAKKGFMAVRVEGCPDPSKAGITGTAEGLVAGKRQTVPLNLIALSPGVYSVPQNWPQDGVWVLHFSGSYQNLKASALVPIGPSGFMREPSKFFPRPATAAEIDSALRALAGSRGAK